MIIFCSELIYKEERVMVDLKMPHPSHEGHLCLLQNVGYLKSNLEEYRKLVKDPQYICKGCGRAAASEKNLCTPEKL